MIDRIFSQMYHIIYSIINHNRASPPWNLSHISTMLNYKEPQALSPKLIDYFSKHIISYYFIIRVYTNLYCNIITSVLSEYFHKIDRVCYVTCYLCYSSIYIQQSFIFQGNFFILLRSIRQSFITTTYQMLQGCQLSRHQTMQGHH